MKDFYFYASQNIFWYGFLASIALFVICRLLAALLDVMNAASDRAVKNLPKPPPSPGYAALQKEIHQDERVPYHRGNRDAFSREYGTSLSDSIEPKQ